MDTPSSTQQVDIAHLKKACSECSLQDLCLPEGISSGDMERLEQLVERVGPLHRGDHLFRRNDVFSSLYAVRVGCIKSYIDNEAGDEQVIGFHLAGELVGLGAIYPGRHQCSAVSLDTAMVCRLPFARLSSLSGEIASLQRQLLRIMSRDLDTAQMLSGDRSVEERLAAFLLGFGDRQGKYGLSARHFILPMTREDIGSYLRLATETVSRALTRFEERGLIRVHRREIWLEDRGALEVLCPDDLRL